MKYVMHVHIVYMYSIIDSRSK